MVPGHLLADPVMPGLGGREAGRQTLAHWETIKRGHWATWKLENLDCHTAVWVRVAQVNISEMRSRVKLGSPSGFLCHTN